MLCGVRRPPDYKPVSVPLRAAAIPLDRPLLAGSSDLPESRTERAAPPLLFGLAPRGVYPASRISPAAVRSYRTFSPLPGANPGRYVFCGTFRETRFERIPPAINRHAALWRPDFPPPKNALRRSQGAAARPAASYPIISSDGFGRADQSLRPLTRKVWGRSLSSRGAEE